VKMCLQRGDMAIITFMVNQQYGQTGRLQWAQLSSYIVLSV
jgi:hypothetical protein